LFGSAEVQVFWNHFFKEDAARSIQNLGEEDLDLENGKVASAVLMNGSISL